MACTQLGGLSRIACVLHLCLRHIYLCIAPDEVPSALNLCSSVLRHMACTRQGALSTLLVFICVERHMACTRLGGLSVLLPMHFKAWWTSIKYAHSNAIPLVCCPHQPMLCSNRHENIDYSASWRVDVAVCQWYAMCTPVCSRVYCITASTLCAANVAL